MGDLKAEIPKGHPLRDAWERYKLSEEYPNTRRWALNSDHVDGSLWAAFAAGFQTRADLAAERIAELEAREQELVGKNHALAAAVFKAAVALEDAGQNNLALELFEFVQPIKAERARSANGERENG